MSSKELNRESQYAKFMLTVWEEIGHSSVIDSFISGIHRIVLLRLCHLKSTIQ